MEAMEIKEESSAPKKDGYRTVSMVVLCVIVLALITILAWHADLFRFFLSKDRILAFLNSLGPWGVAGFVLLQALQVIIAPIPGDVTGFLGGYLYGPWLGVLYSTVGLTVGSYAAFLLGRLFGKPLVRRFVPPEAMKRFNFLLHHKGAYIVFLLFLIPGIPKDYLCYILGLGELSSLEFITIGGVGRLFGTVLLTMGGNYIRCHEYANFGILCGVALVLIFVGLAYRDKLERRLRLWHLKSLRKKSRLSADNG